MVEGLSQSPYPVSARFTSFAFARTVGAHSRSRLVESLGGKGVGA